MTTTQYIEAKSHSNDFTEFEFPKYCMKNIRLLSLGVNSYVQSPASSNLVQYPYNSGSSCLIDTITLYSGTQIINQVRNVQQLMAFFNLNEDSSTNYSLNSNLTKNSLSYDCNGTIDIEYSSPDLGSSLSYSYLDLWKLLPFCLGLEADAYSQLSNAVKTKNKRKITNLINAASPIRSDVLNLRLVIEYSKLNGQQLFVNGQVGDSWGINRPVLCVDKVKPDNSTSFNVIYDNYELEQVTSEGVVINTDKELDLPLYGCEGKFVKELFVMNCKLTNQQTPYSVNAGSVGLYKENINFVCNGVQVCPNNNINTTARKQMMLSYSHPTQMLPPMASSFAHGCNDPNNLFGLAGSASRALQSYMSYTSFELNKKIDSLRLLLSFRGGPTTTQLGNMNICIYYQVNRVLTYSNGNVILS